MLWLGVALLSASVHANDEIVLKDGSRVLGTVKDADNGVLVVQTAFAGDIRIKLAEIASLSTAAELSFLLDDGTYIENQRIAVADGQIVSAQAMVTNGVIPAVSAIKLLNPEPWELGQGYNWSGLGSAALGMDRGNTRRDELDLDLDTGWRSTRDRYTLRGLYEVDRADGVRIRDLWRLLGKYDIFTETTWYYGANVRLESDTFANLNLRTYIGPYLGNQFYDSKRLRLSVETGIVYVIEEFDGADNNKAIAGNWNIDASSNVLGDKITLYLSQNGTAEVDTGDLLVSTRAGMRFPLIGGLQGAAEFAVDFDSGAAPGVRELDQRYRFRIGYSW
jgi:hypothetical protein